MKTFCNNFLSDNNFYADFPLHQFLRFRRCLFICSKKFLVSISAYLNRKLLRLFYYSCPYTDYNYDNLKILNEFYYDFSQEKAIFDQKNGPNSKKKKLIKLIIKQF